MKILFVILTCNRMHYLKNCVKSVNEFVQGANILVVDNCSSETGISEYLNSILSHNICVHRFIDRASNELYRAMNYAIEYCIDNMIDIVNFVQDDYQYLFNNNNILLEVQEIFAKHKHVGQIHTNFLWKRKWRGTKIHSYKKSSALNTKYAIFDPKLLRLCDNGFTRVSLYKKIGMYPTKAISYDQNYAKTKGFGKQRYKNRLNGEMWFQNRCYRLGISRAVSMFPNQGMMCSCAYVRGTKRFGKYFPPVKDYYICPLSDSAIKQVHENNINWRFSFIEQFVQSDGWKPAGPGKHDIYSKIECDI